jgi:predicted kinase
MDLEANGQGWAARELVRSYERSGASAGSQELRSFYAAHRALVSAKVALISASERTGADGARERERAQRLWSLAERLCWRARAPTALVACGPAASGKSTLAGELSRRSGMPVLSADEVRKRLAHVGPHERAGEEHYGEHFSHETYRQLALEALHALRGGPGVIVDATCRSREDRRLLLDGLSRGRAAPLLVRCDVPLQVALERSARRLGDPERVSDATPEIVRAQHERFEDFGAPEGAGLLTLDTLLPLDQQVAQVTRAVDRTDRG